MFFQTGESHQLREHVLIVGRNAHLPIPKCSMAKDPKTHAQSRDIDDEVRKKPTSCNESNANGMSLGTSRKTWRNGVFDAESSEKNGSPVDEWPSEKTSRLPSGYLKEEPHSRITTEELKRTVFFKSRRNFFKAFRKSSYNLFESECEQFEAKRLEDEDFNFYETQRNQKRIRRSSKDRMNHIPPEISPDKLRFPFPPSGFSDVNQIQTRVSFAAYIKRRSSGFTASCTQTFRKCDCRSFDDVFEREVRSNVTFNPLFEDDDAVFEAEEEVRRNLNPSRYRLYTIKEETEPEEYDHCLISSI